ncbi:MAG TPA: NAD(P)-dependent alcohol dehydrogenase [Candidatus Aerophobetes bacterium]|uniref:NAD(P)-dependent alcohol dehydrogenase n=3 Tax=Aerophobetes bacterium TaxID=2030807 RepID=A0A7V0QQY0_UNCAE|nr:NAD(P)-dependent alcohol dehydrogenase [Candidatus Aerophobetes bacterium]
MKITAMYLEKPGKIISRKIDMPEIKKDEVLVKIKAVGVCGSDVHYYDKGKIGSFIVKRPLILGHECSGEIVEVGEEVKNLQIGDKVALEPGIPCRRCIYCKTGRYNLCPEIRFMATPPVNGAFVEYVAHPADFVFKLPENVSYEEATLFEPLAVGLYSVVRAKVGFGGKILILGAGPIGLSTLQAAINIGGGRITVADIYDFRLEKAKELGADELINPRQTNALDKLGSSFDYVFETAGSVVTTQQTVKLAKNGGKVILVGLPAQEEIEFNTNQIITKELDVLGIFRYANMYPKAIRLAEKGQVNLKTVISKKFSFSQTEEALKFARDNKESSIKTVVIFD